MGSLKRFVPRLHRIRKRKDRQNSRVTSTV